MLLKTIQTWNELELSISLTNVILREESKFQKDTYQDDAIYVNFKTVKIVIYDFHTYIQIRTKSIY